MRLPYVNPKLLPIKAHYFLMIGSISSLTPFMAPMAKQRGYSAFLVGIVLSVLPTIAVLSRPVFGAIADRYRCQKKMVVYMTLVLALVTASYAVLPDPPADVDNGDDVAALLTYQFWLFAVFMTARYVTKSVLVTLSETICLQSLGKETHKFGEQRLWGTFGWGTVTAISGWLMDWYSTGESTKNYTPGIILWTILLLVDLFVSIQIQDSQSVVVSKNIYKDLKKVIRDVKVLNFLICIVFFGIFYASASLYLLWHVEELVAKYHPEYFSSLKTIQGAIIFVKCFFGEAPFFFISGKIIKKIGHVNSIVIGLIALSARFFLYFFIKDPMLVLPVELLSGLGYALPYSAMTAYGAIIAPEGLKGTVQGLIGTAYQGIGMGLGSVITGYLFDKIGSNETFLVLGVAVLIFCIVQTITTQIVLNKTSNSKTKENSEVVEVEKCPNKK